MIYGDSTIPDLGVEGCCDDRRDLGASIVDAQQKLEHVYSKAWRKFALADPPVRWWVFSEDDVWLNWRALPDYLNQKAWQAAHGSMWNYTKPAKEHQVAVGGTAPWDFVDCQWVVHEVRVQAWTEMHWKKTQTTLLSCCAFPVHHTAGIGAGGRRRRRPRRIRENRARLVR